MKLEIFRENAELLLDLTKKYNLLIEQGAPESEKKKVAAYMDSILTDIEKNIKENVKESAQASPTTS
jgi:hypothetical protein